MFAGNTSSEAVLATPGDAEVGYIVVDFKITDERKKNKVFTSLSRCRKDRCFLFRKIYKKYYGV